MESKGEGQSGSVLAIKAIRGSEIKRFDIEAGSTFKELLRVVSIEE